MTSPAPARTLRDRKRERTRLALIDAAADLFERRGYDRTTVADIAAAADIGTRTFFSYFASKEELLFPESDARVRAAEAAIAARRPGDHPADVLLRALHEVGEASDEIGYAKVLFQKASKEADSCGTMVPAVTTSRSMKLLFLSRVKYWSPMLRPPVMASALSATNSLLCMR